MSKSFGRRARRRAELAGGAAAVPADAGLWICVKVPPLVSDLSPESRASLVVDVAYVVDEVVSSYRLIADGSSLSVMSVSGDAAASTLDALLAKATALAEFSASSQVRAPDGSATH